MAVRRVADDLLGGNYELPGGGVDKGETIIDGACRELQEETGSGELNFQKLYL